MTIITVRQADRAQDWLMIHPFFPDIPIEVNVVQHDTPAGAILKQAGQTSPNPLILGWQGQPPRRKYRLGSTLDQVLQQARCNLIVIKARPTWPQADFVNKETIKVLAPTAGGPNMPLVMNLALFLTNLISISAASGLVFFLLGFRPKITRQGRTHVFGGGVLSSAILFLLVAWILWTLPMELNGLRFWIRQAGLHGLRVNI
jgi:hypothetical protein